MSHLVKRPGRPEERVGRAAGEQPRGTSFLHTLWHIVIFCPISHPILRVYLVKRAIRQWAARLPCRQHFPVIWRICDLRNAPHKQNNFPTIQIEQCLSCKGAIRLQQAHDRPDQRHAQRSDTTSEPPIDLFKHTTLQLCPLEAHSRTHRSALRTGAEYR